MLHFHTAGESHGKALAAILDGFPAGVALRADRIDDELRRRQGGYGRGERQRLEADRVEILSGLWRGRTIGSPIALVVRNEDATIDQREELASPRPGHGDLSGAMKYLGPMRGVLERASARETAARVAVGAVAAQLLDAFGITAFGYVVSIGPVVVASSPRSLADERTERNKSRFFTLDAARDAELAALVDRTRTDGDTLGGVVEARVEGVPFGLGTHARWDERLDARLAAAVMSVPSVKGVEIGLGFEAARRLGSEVHDPIRYDPAFADSPSLGFTRPTNHAGGIEAGMSNARPIVLRAALKPISTLARPLESARLDTHESTVAARERSDVCAVPAASCVLENVVAFEIARAVVDKFGGDSLEEMLARWRLFQDLARKRMDRGAP